MAVHNTARTVPALLLAGTALSLPSIAFAADILTLGNGQAQRAQVVAGQRVQTSGAATQLRLDNGGIVSFVGAGAFTASADGSVTVHAGNATVVASRDTVRVSLPGGATAQVTASGGGTFNVNGNTYTGNVLAGRVTFNGGNAFTAGQAWRAAANQTPSGVIANGAQAAPAVVDQRTGGIVAAATNGQPVSLGQALAAIGASGDVVSAAVRLQATAENPSLATFPVGDAATLVEYATRLSQIYGAPAFQGAGPDLVRAYLSYLEDGGLPAQFQTAYGALMTQYIELLQSGGLPADFTGASAAAINAYLAYVRATGAFNGLSAEYQTFINTYLEALAAGGGVGGIGDGFTTAYVQAITAYISFLQGGGLPSQYTALSATVIRQYLEALAGTGLLNTLFGAQATAIQAYLDYLRTGGNPDQFPGLPTTPTTPTNPNPVDPGPVGPAVAIAVRGSLSFGVPGQNGHTSLAQQNVPFASGRPTEIPTGSSVIYTENGTFADVFENDALIVGRFTGGKFTLSGREWTLNENQGVHYAFAKTGVTTIPTSGAVTYSLLSATKATFENGASAPGTFAAQLAVTYGASVRVAIDGTITMPNDATYSFTSPSGAANPSGGFTANPHAQGSYTFTSAVTGQGRACAGTADCTMRFYLTPAGANAAYLAASYATNGGERISGAAAFGPAGSTPTTPTTPTQPGTPTVATNQNLAYAGSEIGIDGRDKVTITTDGAGTLDKYVWTKNTTEAPERGTNKSLEAGAAGSVIGWSRWADGKTAGTFFTMAPVTRGANSGVALVYGEPATNVPTTGTATYALVGSTKPTIRDGSVAPGSVTGSAAVAFGATAKVGVDMNVAIGGHTYAVKTTGGVATPGSSEISVRATDMAFSKYGIGLASGGPACGGATCEVDITGFLAGAGASHVGLAYTIAGGTFTKQVDGVAVFGK